MWQIFCDGCGAYFLWSSVVVVVVVVVIVVVVGLFSWKARICFNCYHCCRMPKIIVVECPKLCMMKLSQLSD